MKMMQRAMWVAVMMVAMGGWTEEVRGDGIDRPASADPIPRFTIQADTNCVVDNLTGLMWARNANLPGATQSWAQAIAFCKNLNYGGHTDWRLPTLREFNGLMVTFTNTSVRLSNTEGTAKWKEGDPFTNVRVSDYYWLCTTTVGEPAGAGLINLQSCLGISQQDETTGVGYVWPVRDVKSDGSSAGGAELGVGGEPCLVKDGKPGADIVIADKPLRAVKLAAVELQTYIEKISGALLPITITPGTNVGAHIYVGRSAHTDKLNITDDGLQGGAFRMVSGKDYLVLLGHDKDFTPNQYWPKNYDDRPRALKEWDARTGEHWENLVADLVRNPATGLWAYDERGTLNAVYEFLRGLGVRWYMPGDLGEIVPKLNTLALPSVDKTVKPDFPYRNLGANFVFRGNWDTIMYLLRIGVDATLGIPGPHGLANALYRAEVKQAHPEFYANHRMPDLKNPYNWVACLSSQELVDYTVKYARTVFDIYPDLKYLSIMPGDGASAISMCQCELCESKKTPDRGERGELSDYIWGFTERVAREVYKTHPDRKILNDAYGTHKLPPEKIAKFSPNVMVGIVQPRCYFNDPKVRAQWLEIRKGYLDKVAPGNLFIYCHYRDSYAQLPSYFPHAIAEDLRSLKGLSQGEFIEETDAADFDRTKRCELHAPGFNHLNFYVTARCYWDANQDIEALLNEYYEKFYGPAAKEMKAFIEYSEANWTKMNNDAVPIGKALDLLVAARKAAGDGIYGKRVDLLVDYCQESMTKKMAKLAKGRNKDLKFTAQSCGKPPVKLDGKLDKAFWKDLPEYSLVDLTTGQAPTNGVKTTFRIAWCDDDAVYFGIRCEDPDIKGLNIKTREQDNSVIWDGDNIDLVIETQQHSYYQLAIGPNGVFVDADRKGGGIETIWNSGAQAAGYVGDGYWSLEVRIPVAGDDAETINPLIGIAGHKPTAESPWYFNLGRQRMRGTVRESSASAPPKKDGTGGGFHDLWNFGQLIVK